MTLWYNRRPFADACSWANLLVKIRHSPERAGMAIANTWWFQHFNIYISLSKVSWNSAKRVKGANKLRAQAKRKSRPVLVADDHTPFGTVGYSRDLSTELNIATLSGILCFSEASECRCSSALGKNASHKSKHVTSKRRLFITNDTTNALFSTDWGD